MRISHCLFQYSPFNVCNNYNILAMSIMAILAVRSDLTVFRNSESQLPSLSSKMYGEFQDCLCGSHLGHQNLMLYGSSIKPALPSGCSRKRD